MVNLVNEKNTVIFGNDTIVIQKFLAGIKGGRALDVTGFSAEVINAGHVIITDGNGTYKPMPVSDTSYASLPDGYSYAGILVHSILASKPAAAIMTIGQVNEKALPYEAPADFKTACPHIEFIKDEESK